MSRDQMIRPAPAIIATAAELLRAGKLVAFPTETVYGLGANALDPVAVGRIFAAKGRPATNPLIVHVADTAGAAALTDDWTATEAKLAEAFWPGPLTLVLRKRPQVPDIVTAGGPTIAVRCPNHPVALALIREAGIPVAAPSANRSGELSPTIAEHVARSLGDRVELILDGGPCPGGVESTVVDLTGPTVRLLRPGLVTLAQLEAVIGPVEVGAIPTSASQPLPSPGMLTRHYAPHTALELADTAEEAGFLADLYTKAGLKVARWSASGSSREVAAHLYADLHTLDHAGFDRIIATLPPDTDDWRAIRDRLTRAAAEE